MQNLLVNLGKRSEWRKGALLAILGHMFALVFVMQAASAKAKLPCQVLWAWQRAENLEKINPQEFGVAYLACRVLLTGADAKVSFRQQSLKVPSETALVPVVRIDTDRRQIPDFSEEQLGQVLAVLKRCAAGRQTSEVQIDFDALESERIFYRRLLERARQELPAQIPISITALASWCIFDNWIKELPVDEMVPMMFSLGAEREKILLYFKNGSDFRVASSCKSLGISLEEPEIAKLMIGIAKRRKIPVRIFIFARRAWNDKKINAVRELLKNP